MPSATSPASPCPLQGIRVLDLTSVLAGPYSTYQLALLGAEVIKVERPGEGDWARQGTPATQVPEFSAQFVAQNAGKKSVLLDLQTRAGQQQALELAQGCDILVESFSPGVAERLGLGYDAVRGRRPDIVYCSVSGYGQDGEMSRRPAYDHVVQAASGITMLTGTAETVPNRIGPPMIDYLAGIYAAFAVLSALRERDRTGQPQRLDVAMLDAAMVSMASTVSLHLNASQEPRANGNTAASGSPVSGIFPTREGLLSIAANMEAQFVRAMQAMDLEPATRDPRFATAQARATHVDALRNMIAERLKARPAAEWEAILSAAHVPAARVRTVPQMMAEPHVETRGIRQQVTDRRTGRSLWVPSLGFKWNGKAIGPTSGPPRLGEHTASVLQGHEVA